MDNIDYRNKDKELQIYHGSLDNYEESGNTQNDYINDSNSHNNLSSNYEISQDGLGNISEDGYTETYYSKKRTETRGKHKEKDYMPDFLLGAFIFLLIGLNYNLALSNGYYYFYSIYIILLILVAIYDYKEIKDGIKE